MPGPLLARVKHPAEQRSISFVLGAWPVALIQWHYFTAELSWV